MTATDNINKPTPDFDALKSGVKKSLARRLAEIFPQIEDALKNGVGHSDIFDHLKSQGFEMSFKTYTVTLSRIRVRTKKAKKSLPENGAGKAPLRESARILPIPVAQPTVHHDLTNLPEW